MAGDGKKIDPTWRTQTKLVRGGLGRSEYRETAEAIYMTSGFVYDSAEDAEDAFNGSADRYIYTRYGNPTVASFQNECVCSKEQKTARQHQAACQQFSIHSWRFYGQATV